MIEKRLDKIDEELVKINTKLDNLVRLENDMVWIKRLSKFVITTIITLGASVIGLYFSK